MRETKRFFRRFLEAAPDRIHFAAHSHHYWPDASFDAHVKSWLDAAQYADRKWDVFFGEVWPKAQAHVARVLSLPRAETVAFAPNTHELVSRVLSGLEARRPRILTTDGEFHSFARQSRRLEETGDAEVVRVPVEPFSTFAERFGERATKDRFDIVFFSHVMFGSGWVVPELEAIVRSVAARETAIVIDGYHGFLALPTSLASLAERVFYVAGGYKYAMSGEGTCFLHAPPGYCERPRSTGWFASFGALAQAGGGVEYGADGARFLGATFDPTAIYRFVAVMDWLEREQIAVADVHAHVMALQERFVHAIDEAALPFSSADLVVPVTAPLRGHFLTFRRSDAASLYEKLLAGNVITDVRGDRLRIGFGLYHDEEDIDRGIARMKSLFGR
jgi:selenocysteine lyase/cysteine desulfurase